MRIVLTPRYEQIEEKEPFKEPKEIYRFAFEFFEGSGNIHITKTSMIVELFETIDDNVIVFYKDNDKDIVENYTISSIRP